MTDLRNARELLTANIPPDPLLMSIREAAQRLRISERTLWSLTAPRGGIKCVRLTGRVLYSPEALRAFIAQQEAASVAGEVSP